ncbi:MAG: hypothetical protein HGB02_00915 [Chlorobiaceae bacterium]|nr:hypothetical protein [Chlorobiaceae bacterium]
MKPTSLSLTVFFWLAIASPALADDKPPGRLAPEAGRPGMADGGEEAGAMKRVRFVDEDGDGINDLLQGRPGLSSGSRIKDFGMRDGSGAGLFTDNDGDGRGRAKGQGSLLRGAGR